MGPNAQADCSLALLVVCHSARSQFRLNSSITGASEEIISMRLRWPNRIQVVGVVAVAALVMFSSVPFIWKPHPKISVGHNVTVPGPPRSQSYFYITNIAPSLVVLSSVHILVYENGRCVEAGVSPYPRAAFINGGKRVGSVSLQPSGVGHLVVDGPIGVRWRIAVDYSEEVHGIRGWLTRGRLALYRRSFSLFSPSVTVYRRAGMGLSDELGHQGGGALAE